MSDAVAVALITVVLGGLLGGFFKYIESKANKAQEEVNASVAVIEASNHTINGMKILVDSQRAEFDRQRANDQARIEKLEHDLLEEKALNVALSKELEKKHGENAR